MEFANTCGNYLHNDYFRKELRKTLKSVVESLMSNRVVPGKYLPIRSLLIATEWRKHADATFTKHSKDSIMSLLTHCH